MLAGNNIYHFISNRSLLVKDFPIRVYPVGPVQITFSNSKDQTNHTVQILMEKTKTVVTINGTKITEEVPVIKYNSLNNLILKYSKNHISVDSKFKIDGDLHSLRFIGFDSVKDTSWVIQNSK